MHNFWFIFSFLLVKAIYGITNVFVNTTNPINTVSENFLGFVFDSGNAKTNNGQWYTNLT